MKMGKFNIFMLFKCNVTNIENSYTADSMRHVAIFMYFQTVEIITMSPPYKKNLIIISIFIKTILSQMKFLLFGYFGKSCLNNQNNLVKIWLSGYSGLIIWDDKNDTPQGHSDHKKRPCEFTRSWLSKWAMRESNLRLLPCQGSTLNHCVNCPRCKNS